MADAIEPTGDAPIRRIVVVSAGTSEPSTTRMLADRVARDVIGILGDQPVAVAVIELAPLAVDIARALVAGFPGPALQEEIERLARADAVIAATPVYKAGVSGLFKSFLDVLDNDLLVGKPIVVAATAGTARHSLVADEQMRPLFAFMRALVLPTSLFAAPEDWSSPELTERIRRAATELAVTLRADVGAALADVSWQAYRHEFGGNAIRAARSADDVDFATDLMRLATGGDAAPRTDRSRE